MNISIKRVLCVLLVCLVLCSTCLEPVRADAAAIAAGAAVIGGVELANVCAGILATLGVCYGLSTVDYESLIAGISDALPSDFVISNPKDNLKYTNVISYNDTTYVPESLVKSVQQYLYAPSDSSTSVVKPTYSPSGEFAALAHSAASSCKTKPYSLEDFLYCYEMTLSNGRRDLFFTNTPMTVKNGNGQCRYRTTGLVIHDWQSPEDVENKFVHGKTYDSGTAATSEVIYDAQITSFKLADVASLTQNNSYDLVIGNLAPDLDDEEYASWAARKKLFVVKPSGDGDGDGNNDGDKEQKVYYVPVRLLQTLLESAGQTQSDAQSGRDSTVELDTSLVPNSSAEPAVKPSPGIDASTEIVPAELDGTETSNNVLGWLSLIYKALINVMFNIIKFFDFVRAIPAHIQTLFEWIWEHLNTAFETLKTAIQTSFEWLWEHLNAAFEALKTTIQTSFEWIWTHLNTAFETLKTTIQTSFEWLWQNLRTFFENVWQFLEEFWATSIRVLKAFGDYLLEGIKNIFVPSEDFLTAKLEAIKAKFPFVNSIITTGQALGGAFGSFYTEPPIIYAELHNATGSYYYGDRAVILDLRWYSQYKPTVDILISAFLWAVFCWRMFLKIPGIISGMPGDFVMDAASSAGVLNDLPTRSAGYEVQRQSNRDFIRRLRKK